MAILYYNALINVTDMNGVVKYKSKSVQLDDESPLSEKTMDGIPIIDKIIYDQPNIPIGYNRGDVVTILKLNDEPVPAEDNIFWIERAILGKGPLAAWEVGICGGRVTNITTSIGRVDNSLPGAKPFLVGFNVRGTYVPPALNKGMAYGDVSEPILLLDPFIDVRQSDIFTITKIDGFATADQTKSYNAVFVAKHPTPVPHFHIKLSGALQ